MVLALRRLRLSGARSTSLAAATAGSMSSTSSISDFSKKPCSSSTSRLVEIELGDRVGDLGVRQHADLLTLGDEALDLFEFLQFDY